MSTSLRIVKVPYKYKEDATKYISELFPGVSVEYAELSGKMYAVFSMLNDGPVVIQGAKPQSLQRNADKDDALPNIKPVVFASDLDLGGQVVFDLTNLDNTVGGLYTVSAVATDGDGVSKTYGVSVRVVDTLKPIITATNVVLADAPALAAWDNGSMSALDNTLDDVTGDVVPTYHEESNGTGVYVDLAAFKEFLSNSGTGERVGYVTYNVTDAYGNVADPVTISVTTEAFGT
jgi:hypothetical protein